MDNVEAIYSITTEEERACLASLAAAVPAGGLILEIGTLYGGTTAVLAQAAPAARVISIDDYSWTPDGVPNSPAQVYERLEAIGVRNVELLQGDSRWMWQRWNEKIDLLWIDGGHSFEYVYSDLHGFGRHADVIALHDFRNPQWITIEKAIDTYIYKNRIWQMTQVAGMVAVLRKIV